MISAIVNFKKLKFLVGFLAVVGVLFYQATGYSYGASTCSQFYRNDKDAENKEGEGFYISSELRFMNQAREQVQALQALAYLKRQKIFSNKTLTLISEGVSESMPFAELVSRFIFGRNFTDPNLLDWHITSKQLDIISHLKSLYTNGSVNYYLEGAGGRRDIDALTQLVFNFHAGNFQMAHPTFLKKGLLYFDLMDKLLSEKVPFKEVLWLTNLRMLEEYRVDLDINPENIEKALKKLPWALVALLVDPKDNPPKGTIRIRYSRVRSFLDKIETDSDYFRPINIKDELERDKYLDIDPKKIDADLEEITQKISRHIFGPVNIKSNPSDLRDRRNEVFRSMNQLKSQLGYFQDQVSLLNLSPEKEYKDVAMKLQNKLTRTKNLLMEMQIVVGDIDSYLRL